MKEDINCKDGVCEFNPNEDIKETCNCESSCDCGCQEGKECTCNDGCHCDCDCGCQDGEECTCGDECNCDGDGECNCECDNEKTEKKKLFQFKKDKNDQKVKELEDALLRSKAEFVNYRRRLEEEQVKFMKYANEDLIKELLPIIDNFERAIKLDDNDLTDELSKFLEGFKMTYCSLLNILEKFGVVAIDGANKPFDANFHQAVVTDHVEGVESGMVLEVLQKGYLLKGKVIRHAMVKVNE